MQSMEVGGVIEQEVFQNPSLRGVTHWSKWALVLSFLEASGKSNQTEVLGG